MSAIALAFNEFNLTRQAAVGGKAGTLVRLYQAGYPVPDGFIILPQAFDGDNLKPNAWPQIQIQLMRFRRNHRDTLFAVRSSALSEDSAQASFAGEFETVLEVGEDTMIRQAIHTVRRSRQSGRVKAYSQAKQVDSCHEIAVIIQQMILSQLSGVLFTVDPVTGKRGSMLGNYVQGTGDQLVSGETTGQKFSLRRLDGRYHGPKELKRHSRKLYKLAKRLEHELGTPQDIEWAIAGNKLYLLQSRPITTLHGHNPANGEWNDSLLDDFLWSNVNVGEAYGEPMTPFTWSLVETAFSEMSLLPGYNMIGNIGGHPYSNLSVGASIFRALGINVQNMAKEFAGGVDKFLEGMTIPEIPVPRSAVLTILYRTIRMRWKQWWVLQHKDQYLTKNLDWCRRMMDRIRGTQSTGELFDLWYGEVSLHGMEFFWLLGASAYGYGRHIAKLRQDLTTLVGREDADILMSNVSSETELLASLGPVVGLWRLYRGEITAEEFLSQYGHRGANEGEYMSPRPAEDPGWLDRQMKAFASDPVDVEALLATQQKRFNAAWNRLKSNYPHRARSVHRRLEKAAAAARLREAVRSEMVRLGWVSRTGALKAGELTGLGDDVFFLRVEELEAILRDRPTDAIRLIPARRQTYERYRTLPPYPAVIRGQFYPFQWAAGADRRTDFYDSHEQHVPADANGAGNKLLKGSPGSTGQAEGIVRFIESPEMGHSLQTGEILVAAKTNIGWTLLFPRAAAIITDIGAPLSHAAIVARELGIPAVVGCGDATSRLKTGDRVRVDGTQGVVELLSVK